ncbi:hypothetical protein XENOCAPTIV_017726, partial [Xenoophorus captivus]
RCLEDHELVVQVQASMSSDSKFLFRKNYAKYEFFTNPLGYLYVKEPGRKSWKKLYMFLRRSGLYYSTKGTSKEPRHLQLLSDLEDNNIFTVITGRKLHNAPADFQFCIKTDFLQCVAKAVTHVAQTILPIIKSHDAKTHAELELHTNRDLLICSTHARLVSPGLIPSHLRCWRRCHPISCASPPPPDSTLYLSSQQRSVSENSLVAMDFSGRTGRVIDNPVEAQSAALEEGQTWRVSKSMT